MKEITRIHLATTPYNIEIGAKKELETYVSGIEKALSADEDTLREIEARMMELLSERGVSGEKVITSADIAALRDRLGAPGEFTDEPGQTFVGSNKKRLLRDEQNGMVGGVLAGLAAYSNVDVVWYRIAFVVLAFASLGTMLLVYVLFWIAIPAARTAAERLQMRGKNTSLENIQAESSYDIEKTPVHKKPLVVLLRIVSVIGLLGVLFGALATVVIALVAGIPTFSADNWMSSDALVAALIVGAVSGVLLAVLAAVLVYMVAAWKASKTLIVVSACTIAAGILSFTGSLGLLAYGANQSEQKVAEHTVIRRESLPELEGSDKLRIDNTNSIVRYNVSEGAPYAEVQTLHLDKTVKLPLEVAKSGRTTTIKIGELPAHSCSSWLDDCAPGQSTVTIYGPQLSALDVGDADVTYEADNTRVPFAIVANKGAEIALSGRFESVDMSLSGSSVYAAAAAISSAVVSVDDDSNVSLGVMKSLALKAPNACGAESKSDIEYEQATVLTLNGDTVAGRADQELPCVALETTDDY